jgi:hypothetical protein
MIFAKPVKTDRTCRQALLDTDFRYPCFTGERLKPAPFPEILLSYPHQPDEGFQQNPQGIGTTFA